MFKMFQDAPIHLLVGFGLILIGCSLAAVAPSGNPTDPTTLPIGDGKVSSSAKMGSVFSCQIRFPPFGGAFQDGPWIKPDGTFDITSKAVVDGSVSWTSSQAIRVDDTTTSISGNGLPNHSTGAYPVSSTDDAYQFDRNPNTIQSQAIKYTLPANPTVAATPSCLGLGPIGVTLTGAVLFDALDGTGKDAVAHELQDACQGHPERTGQYHYHNLTNCLPDSGIDHSSLMGYALDGFGLYGKRGEDGKVLTDADLDECHGHTHQIVWNGKTVTMYHYHATAEYPYTLGCYRGTPGLK
jgi:YHYH protein